MQPNPRESGHEVILAGEIVAHGAYHALKKELVRAAIMMIAREVLAGIPMGLSEAGALTIESIALGTGGMILTNFAIGAVAGVGVAAEVYLAEAAYRSTAQAVYTVLSKGRDY